MVKRKAVSSSKGSICAVALYRACDQQEIIKEKTGRQQPHSKSLNGIEIQKITSPKVGKHFLFVFFKALQVHTGFPRGLEYLGAPIHVLNF